MTAYNCKNIFSGFQALHPRLFALTGEVLGDILGQKLPFNVQNALGDWIQCVAQVIITYNSKQQYFQGGPGRYYNIMYKNVSNPFCTGNQNTTEGNSSSGLFFDALASSVYSGNTTSTSYDEDIDIYDFSINELDNRLRYLEFELLNLKKEIDTL